MDRASPPRSAARDLTSLTRQHATPAAFRRALTDRLRARVAASHRNLAQLQRQLAYDRLLERLYSRDEAWILKGATALLAREIGVRATIDVDLHRATEPDLAEADLRAAAQTDIGDWFVFDVGPTRPAGDAASARRLPVTARVGNTTWASFHVDIAGPHLRMTGGPERVQALARLGMPDVEQHGYHAYPLVDHIADKLAAMYESHGAVRASSTRFRDLVDLVAITVSATVAARPLRHAVESEAARRGITLPDRLVVPDRSTWEAGYAAEARRSLLSEAITLDAALQVVGALIDPVLDGSVRGAWDPRTRTWRRSR